jgi:hypothetical protein
MNVANPPDGDYPSWQVALAERYPLALSEMRSPSPELGTPTATALARWGIECQAGWQPLIERLLHHLEIAIAAESPERRHDLRIVQMKEKLGRLTVYLAGEESPAMDAAIKEAAQHSARTCEICGERGRPAGPTCNRIARLRRRATAGYHTRCPGSAFESPAKLVDVALPRSAAGEPSTGPGFDLLVGSPRPWPDPIDGAALLTDLEAAIVAHAVLPGGAAVAMALWIVHTHCLAAAAITPRLAIVSPTKRCGKTTVLKLLGALASKPLAAASLTPAVLCRVVEAFSPTILVNEAATFLADQDELRGVLNAGHPPSKVSGENGCLCDEKKRRRESGKRLTTASCAASSTATGIFLCDAVDVFAIDMTPLRPRFVDQE